MEERARVERAITAAQEVKAEDIVVYDMEDRSSITDYVLICSGRSQAHVRGISDKIDEALRKAGVRYHSMEGHQEGSWVLMDFDVLLVHVFHPETRTYYDLDGLLKDFPHERYAEPDEDAGAVATS